MSLVTSAATLGKRRFACFDIPIAVLTPKEPVQCLRCFVELIFGKRRRNLPDRLVQLEQNPLVVGGEERALDFALGFAALHLAEPTSIPELVAEIAAQFDVLFVEHDVLAEWRAAHGAEADSVRAVSGDEIEWIWRIAQALAHLAA